MTASFHWDADISNAVRRRILNSPVIQSQGLIVACKDGVVTLSGTVSSYAEEQQAGLLASEVAGVKQVKNNIITKWGSTAQRSRNQERRCRGDWARRLPDRPADYRHRQGRHRLTRRFGRQRV